MIGTNFDSRKIYFLNNYLYEDYFAA